jgi:hypothetical protein
MSAILQKDAMLPLVDLESSYYRGLERKIREELHQIKIFHITNLFKKKKIGSIIY